jgi:uncharacterized protein
VRYWDPSAIALLLAAQAGSDARADAYREDRRVVTWWASKIECTSALCRLRRDQAIDEPGLARAFAALQSFFDATVEIEATEEVRARAMRLLRTHAVRAADALQLAAALVACRENPGSLPFVCSDHRLTAAAEREGFTVL